MLFTVTNKIDANVKALDDSAPESVILKKSMLATFPGIVGLGIHTTTLIADSDVTGFGDNNFKFRVINFTSGINQGRSIPVTAYTSVTGQFVLDAAFILDSPPANGDTFTVT
jgi:hypothetical protein